MLYYYLKYVSQSECDPSHQAWLELSGVSTVGPNGAHAPLTFSLLNVIIK